MTSLPTAAEMLHNIPSTTYNEILDEFTDTYSEEINVHGITMCSMDILRTMDHIAFNEMLWRYIDELYIEIEDIYYCKESYQELGL